MVVISELTGIFWGVSLEGSNKKYSQTTERPVRISMAALDPFQTRDENPVSLMIERDSRSYVLCTLQHGKHFQQPLDLEFASGEELTLFIKGNGVIHLSGYVMPEDETPGPDELLTDSDEEEEEEELLSDDDMSPPGLQSKKRQKPDKEMKKSSKKAKMTIEDIDEEDDDDDTDAEFIDAEAEEDSGDEEDDDDDDDDIEKELLHEDSDAESSDSDEEMDMKKAVTVDKKPNVGKKDKKNVASGGADVKAKPTAQSGAVKVAVPLFTKPATQLLLAAASDMSQVAEGKKKKKKKRKNKNAANQQQQNTGFRG